MELGAREILILDALQYDVVPEPEPFDDLSKALGLSVDDLLRTIRRLKRGGIIRRFGISFHPRALGGISALILASVPPNRALDYARMISSYGRSKHSYVRSFPEYNLWFTYRARDLSSLEEDVRSMLSSMGIEDYVTLLSSRTYKLSVKYDLERGTSWSPPGTMRPDPPTLDAMGISKDVAKGLEDLPLTRRPFRELAASMGEAEEEFLRLVEELMSRGAATGFGAVLEPEAVGFRQNAVVMGRGGDRECEALAREVPEATHVVLRKPLGGSWDLGAYFVVHARERADAESIAGWAAELAGIGDYRIAYGEGGFTT